MLPKSDQKSYQDFLTSLNKLQEQVTGEDLNITKMSENLQVVQEIFQNQLLGLTVDPSWQSRQTEIHRLLRLLATDILFLRSSQQPKTTQQRLQTIRDRLDQILAFCQN